MPASEAGVDTGASAAPSDPVVGEKSIATLAQLRFVSPCVPLCTCRGSVGSSVLM